MPFVAGVVFVVTGLTMMLFGLFLFYAFLPLLFALIGFDIGVFLGRSLTGEVGLVAIGIGIVVAITLAVTAYSLEPYRRIALGLSSGVLAGLSIAAGVGLDGWFSGIFNLLLALAGGLIGGLLVLRFFDALVAVASALGGAGLVMAGAHLLLRGSVIFADGGFWPSVLVVVLAFIGICWQFSNISKWSHFLPASGDASQRDGAQPE